MFANDEKTISIRPPQTDKEVDLHKIKEIQDDEFAVKNEGKCVIIVTHSATVPEYADTVLEIRNGILQIR